MSTAGDLPTIELSRGLVRHLQRAEEELVGRVVEYGVTAITPKDLGTHVELGSLRTQVHAILREPGLALLRGVPLDNGLRSAELMLWILGLQLGSATSQNRHGDRIGKVTADAVVQVGERGYRSRDELNLHTDSDDVLMCLCVSQAPEGGLSRFVHARDVYLRLAAEFPSQLAILRRGFHYHWRGEGPSGEPPVTTYRVPVLAEQDGFVSCVYLRDQIELAATAGAVRLSAEEVDALDVFDSVAHSSDLLIERHMGPGEMYVLNNWTVLHSRTAYIDHSDPTRRRLLLRLWLKSVRAVQRGHHAQRRFYGGDGIEAVPHGATTFDLNQG